MKKRPLPTGTKLYSEQATSIFKGLRFEIFQYPQKRFDGSMVTHELVKRADSVVVLPIVDGQVVVASEKQPHWDNYRLSFIGGLLEDGEDLLVGAKREVEEETGMIFS